MPITVSNLGNSFTQAVQSSFTTGSISPVAYALIVLTVSSNANAGLAGTPSSVSGGGVTWTLINSTNTSHTALAMYRALSSSPGSGAITVNYSSNQNNFYWSVNQFKNVDLSGSNGAGAVVQSQVHTTNGTTSGDTVTLSTLQSGENVAHGSIMNSGATAITKGSNFTELSNISSSQVEESEYAKNQTAVNWTWVSTNYETSAVAIEVKALIAGGLLQFFT